MTMSPSTPKVWQLGPNKIPLLTRTQTQTVPGCLKSRLSDAARLQHRPETLTSEPRFAYLVNSQ